MTVYLLAAMLAAGASATADADKVKKDADAIQGTWQCVVVLQDGKQVERYVGVRAVMRGDRLTWVFPQPGGKPQTLKAVFQLDENENPKHFDWHPETKPAEVHKRLYVLAGDVLIWSTNLGPEPRPESFTAGRWQFIMKRVAGEE